MASGKRSNVPANVSVTAGSMFNLTGQSKYDPTKLYTDGTDSKGHYEQLRLKVTPSMLSLIEQVVSGHPGYKTPMDFIRDACLHRIVYMDQNAILTIDQNALRREMHLAELNRQMAEQKATEEYIATVEQFINEKIEVKDWEAIAHALSEIDGQIEDGAYSPGHREKLQEVSDFGWQALETEQKRKARHAMRQAI